MTLVYVLIGIGIYIAAGIAVGSILGAAAENYPAADETSFTSVPKRGDGSEPMVAQTLAPTLHQVASDAPESGPDVAAEILPFHIRTNTDA